jgi:hypothetical protein
MSDQDGTRRRKAGERPFRTEARDDQVTATPSATPAAAAAAQTLVLSQAS